MKINILEFKKKKKKSYVDMKILEREIIIAQIIFTREIQIEKGWKKVLEEMLKRKQMGISRKMCL